LGALFRMKKYFCVHGHFYQPPRENPWLEAVELQDSAHPYHDWNERITAECYAPNAHSRVLDAECRIERIVNNYSRISFNFGPTLLSWMKEKAPDVYAAIQRADKKSQGRFSGHGSAIAQCYNHLIMPLANARDKQTQVAWGIRDFEARFGRAPEGMWLPECGVDVASLEALAQFGIQFTVLSPFQASRVRPLDGGEWEDVNGGRIDPSRAYRVRLPSGHSIAVFFYDAPVAQAVAFERLLTDGGRFADRLMGACNDSRTWDQLIHVATDGESYGHHFRYGDMALAYALKTIESNSDVRLTVYGEYLESHPPTDEVELHEPSAWSCSHGVDRWRRDCGCNSGGHAGWNQAWREPLRNALDWLRDQLAPMYEEKGKELLKNPWDARDDYINVILDRSPENIKQFLSRHAAHPLDDREKGIALRMLEAQRHALLMYTSCGWFFDELSGLETVQVIQYAARAVQLARDLWDKDLEPGFVERLAEAKSNIPENSDGRVIYEKFVKPAIVTRETVGAHYAVSSIFESYPVDARLYAFSFHQDDRQMFTAGAARLAVGRARVTFEITGDSDDLSYGVLYLGSHNLNCWVHLNGHVQEYDQLVKSAREAFDHGDFAQIIRLMDSHFGQTQYSLKNLFRDEQRKLLNQILTATREEIDTTYKLIADRHSSLLRFLADLRVPPPTGLSMAVEEVLNREIRNQFDGDHLDTERVRSLLAECQAMKVPLEQEILNYACKGYFDRLSDQLLKKPDEIEILQRLIDAAKLARDFTFETNLWKAQNVYFEISRTIRPEWSERAEQGDEAAKKWESLFDELGKALGFSVTIKPDEPNDTAANSPDSAEPAMAHAG
jgi:alpha-amylase/alpha-mannosidase (GH57 family)